MMNASRRNFLAASGAGVLSAAALAACGSTSTVNSSGTAASTSVSPTAPPTTADAKAIAAGIVALRTATSIEYTLVSFYETFAKSSYTTGDAQTLASSFLAHHQANAAALGALTVKAGGKAYTKGNKYLDAQVVQPQLALANNAKSAEKLVALAATLEEVATSNGALAVGTLARIPERVGIMEVTGANARHCMAWNVLNTPTAIAGALPDPLYSLRNALGTDGEIS